jgi:hypothetical protein
MAEKDTKVITGEVRLSYAHVWEPKDDDEGIPWYQTSVLVPKDDEKTIAAINRAVEAAKLEGKAKKWNGKMPAASLLKLPLRDGDEEKPEDPAYAGMYFFNCKSKTQPEIVKYVGKNADKSNKFEKITDTTEVYSGCYVRLSLNFYPFSGKSNGIAVGLNNIIKVRDGEAFSGTTNAADDFADVEFDDMDDDNLY